MILDDFSYNPIIDELLWVRETLGEVTRIIPILDSPSDCRINFLGPSSLEHSYLLKPGWFREWWSDAADILAQEGVIEPMRNLNDHEREMLLPAEAEARLYLQEQKLELEKGQVARAIEEAGKAFRLKQYDRVVSILTEFEKVLEGVNIAKLAYARKKLSSAPTFHRK